MLSICPKKEASFAFCQFALNVDFSIQFVNQNFPLGIAFNEVKGVYLMLLLSFLNTHFAPIKESC